MRFENPLLLLGLAAAAIPIIIHLINKRRAPMVPFAAITFILRSDKRLARKLKLKQLLALALRVALMMAIPFALSRPYCVPDQAPSSGDQPPTSVVLVVDNSLSMAVRLPAGEGVLGEESTERTALEAAKQRARALLQRLGTDSNVAVVTASRPAQVLTPELTFDRGRVLDALDSVDQTDAASDVAPAMQLAEALLASSSLPERRVVLLSDLQVTAFDGLDRVWSLEMPPPVEVVDVVGDSARAALANAAVTNVSVAPAAAGSPEHVSVDVEVAAYGPGGYRGPVTLELGERVVQNTVDVPSGGKGTTSFVIKAGSATETAGAVRLQPDALTRDDQRAFAADLFTSVTVLLVNGAPRTVPYKDELFFIEKALRPEEQASSSRFRTLALKSSELTPEQINASDVVVLANVLDIPADAAAALDGYVRGGGGLLITAGDNSTADYNRLFGELLPIPVRAVKEVVKRGDPDASVKALFIDRANEEHPALRAFTNLRDASLYLAQFYTYLLLDAAAAPADANVVASYRNGAPFLAERRVGRGRVAILTTTLDRDWGDFPIRTSYLPVVQELLLYLAGRSEETLPSGVEVGEAVRIPVSETDRRITVERPNGIVDELSDPQRAGGQLRYERTDLAGVYALRRYQDGAEEPSIEHFAVVPSPAESDLRAFDVARVEEVLAPQEGQEALSHPAVRLSRTDDRRTNVWPFVLAGLFALLLSEAVVVLRS